MDRGRHRTYYIDGDRHELSNRDQKLFLLLKWNLWVQDFDFLELNCKAACVRLRLFCFKGCPARRVGRRGVQAAAVAAVVSEVVKARFQFDYLKYLKRKFCLIIQETSN